MFRLLKNGFFVFKLKNLYDSGSHSVKRSLVKVFFKNNLHFRNSSSYRTSSSFPSDGKRFQIKGFEQKTGTTTLGKYFKSNITEAKANSQRDVITLNFENGESLDYPAIWLRDNCQCTKCFETTSNSRVIDFQTFRDDTIPVNIQICKGELVVEWDDGHESRFSKDWLCDRSFQAGHQLNRNLVRHVRRVPWKAGDFRGTPACQTFSYQDIIQDDAVLLKWLEALAVYGVAQISGTPKSSGQVELLANRVGFLRRTHYGSEFHVKGSEDATNVAYKTGPLQLHTDLPYYHFTPGIILLHCIIQSSKGGENILSDGLNAVKQLTTGQYRILADTVVDWLDIGNEGDEKFYSVNRAPVICEDSLGNVECIYWSQPQRDSVFNVTVPQAIEWYKAVKQFSNILHEPENAVSLKTQPGDMLTFDNRRILHGRTNYTDGRRLLVGGYIDWDEIYSKIRVLRQQLQLHH